MAELSLEQANQLISAIFSEAARLDLPPIAAAVLDSGGHLKSMQRQDGLSFLRADICQAKAWGALAMGGDTRQLAARFSQDAQQQGFLHALNAMSGGKLVPLPGGLLVRDDAGQILGAVGVAGAASDQDEACALVGIRSIGRRTSDD